MKKICFLLVLALFLCGCSGEPTPTQPAGETTTGHAVTSSAVPTEPQDLNPEWKGCEVISPEEGVLILHGNESLQDTIIEGDVYITANAEVTFVHVNIRGALYIHGKLALSGNNRASGIYTYKYEDTLCSAYDGIHGEIQSEHMANSSMSFSECVITVEALDYAFETWGKVEPTEQPPTQVWSEGAEPSPYDPAHVIILSGKQSIVSELFNGDVYITADGDITFTDVEINGNLYVAGKLRLSDTGFRQGFQTNIRGYLYAYDFGVTCEVFDGTHGQVTGGPVFCKGYVVANDALDYAYTTWGKL